MFNFFIPAKGDDRRWRVYHFIRVSGQRFWSAAEPGTCHYRYLRQCTSHRLWQWTCYGKGELVVVFFFLNTYRQRVVPSTYTTVEHGQFVASL